MITNKRSIIPLITTFLLILSACGTSPTEVATPEATQSGREPSTPMANLPPLNYGEWTWTFYAIEACSVFQHSQNKTVEGNFIQIMFECTDGKMLLPAMQEYSSMYLNAISLTDGAGKTFSAFGIRSDGENYCNRTVVLFNNVPDEAGLTLHFLGQPAVELPEPINTIKCTLP